MLEPGQKVQVKHHTLAEMHDYPFGWATRMSNWVGKTTTIRKTTERGGYVLDGDDYAFEWAESSLTTINRKITI